MQNNFPFINRLKTISEKFSDNIAFNINETNYSYHQFYQKVNSIALKLIATNINQQKVIVTTNNDIETYASIIAIWLTGNIYIPLDPIENNERLKALITQINADVVLSSKTINNNYFDGLTVINSSTLSQATEVLTITEINPNDVAYILFTSGTTGIPKGVPISYQNLDAFVDSFLSIEYPFTKEDNFLQMANLTFDMSIISFLIPLCIGAKVTTIGNTEIKYLSTLQTLLEKHITVLITAPSTLQLLEPYYSEINLEYLKYTFAGAEAFYESTAKQWKKCAPNSKIINLYGPSESGILSTFYEWNLEQSEAYKGIVSIGKSVKNVNLHIVDEFGNLLSNKQEGEAWISGVQVFSSYLNKPDNEDKFGELTVNGRTEFCFKTGDIVFRNENGNLFYCGRKDNQVKIQGKRVELAEIEHYARSMSTTFNPIAICYKGQFGSNKIALFVEEKMDKNILLKSLSKDLPSYMIPSKIIQLDKLPLNRNQKTDKKALQLMVQNS